MAKKQAVSPPQVIPPTRLMQAPAPPVVPIQAGPGQPVQIRPPVQPWHPQPTYQQPTYQQPVPPPVPQHGYYGTPHQAYYGPQYVPMPQPMPGAQMHGYLSVPEPVNYGQHWFVRLIYNMVRAALKGMFHQSAHIVDHAPFIKPEPPQLPPAQP